MTDEIVSPTLTVFNDDKSFRGVVDVDTLGRDARAMLLDLATTGHDSAAQKTSLDYWRSHLGVDGYGYTAAVALVMMSQDLLAPLLDRLEELDPDDTIRGALLAQRVAAHKAREGRNRDDH